MYKYRLKDVCDGNKTNESFYGIDPNTSEEIYEGDIVVYNKGYNDFIGVLKLSEENRWYIDADSVIITIDSDNMVTKLKLK